MDTSVNTLLCVGRKGVKSPKRQLFSLTIGNDENESIPSIEFSYQNESVRKHKKKREVTSREDRSPDRSSKSYTPTKSILRGAIASPKQGESPSSLRSVRFSDDEDSDSMVFSNVHINRTTQTLDIDQIDTNEVSKLQFKATQTESRSTVMTFEGRTSPIISKPNEIKMPKQQIQDVHKLPSNKSMNKGDDIIRHIPIKRKEEPIPTKPVNLDDGGRIIQNIAKSSNNNCMETQTTDEPDMMMEEKADEPKIIASPNNGYCEIAGNSIIKNMELGSKTNMNDGRKIIQNMDIGSNNTSRNDSFNECKDDGKRIIQNLEFSSAQPLVQDNKTKDALDKSKENKTLDLEAEKYAFNSKAYLNKGDKIIKNLELSSPRPLVQQNHRQMVASPIPTISSLPSPRLQSLDSSFDTERRLSIDSVSSSVDSNEAVLIYNKHASSTPRFVSDGQPSKVIHKESKHALDAIPTTGELSSHSAMTLLQRETVKQTHNSNIMTPTVTKTNTQQSFPNPSNNQAKITRPDMFKPVTKQEAFASGTQSDTFTPRIKPETFTPRTKPETFMPGTKQDTFTPRNRPKTSTSGTLTATKENVTHTCYSSSTYGKGPSPSNPSVLMSSRSVSNKYSASSRTASVNNGTANYTSINSNYSQTKTNVGSSVHINSANHLKQETHNQLQLELKRTPIETYSFQPRTVTTLMAKKETEKQEPIESVTRNSFIKGFDLGPMPGSTKNETKSQYSVIDNRRKDRFGKGFDNSFGAHSYLERSSNYSDRRSLTRMDNFRSREANPVVSPRNHISLTEKTITARPNIRPSSAVYANTNTNLLTSNLTQIRNTAIRQCRSDTSTSRSTKNPENQLYERNSRQADSHVYRQTYQYQHTSPNVYEKHEYGDQNMNANLYRSSGEQHNITGNARVAERQSRSRERTSRAPVKQSVNHRDFIPITSRSQSAGIRKRESSPTYLESLHDKSNERPTSRHRSTSSDTRRSLSRGTNMRSRSASPTFAEQSEINDRANAYIENDFSFKHAPSPNISNCSSKPPLPNQRISRLNQSPRRKLVDDQSPRRKLADDQSPCRKTTEDQSPHRKTIEDQILRRKKTEDQSQRRKATKDQSPPREPTKDQSPHRESMQSKIPSTIGRIETPIEVKPRSTLDKQRLAPEGSLIYPDNLTVHNTSKTLPQSSPRDVITIGEAPDGVRNKTCIFLGPDTIQKIIEEARL